MTARGGKLRWFGISVLALILLLGSALCLLMLISASRLRVQMAASQAKGRILTFEDLAREKVPDAQNAAPVYKRVFTLMQTPMVRKDVEQLSGFTDPDERRKNPKLWDEARRALARNGNLVDLVKEAQMRPKCLFPINWKDGYSALYLHLAEFRALARFLRASALINARKGRMNEAVHSAELAFRTGEALKDEPSLIGQLVRISVVNIASRGVREIAEYENIDEAQARHLFDVIGDIDLPAGFVRAMEGERAMGIWTFDQIQKDPGLLAQWMNAVSTPTTPATRGQKLLGYAWRPISGLDKAAYLRFMDMQIEASKYPYREAQSKGLFPDERDIPRYAVLSNVIVPIFSKASLFRDTAAAEIAGTRILLALMAYKNRLGSYPSRLKELQDKLGWKLPKDPLTGKALIYKRQGDGFLLYSVGPNMKDEGGVEPGRHANRFDKGDIVWEAER